MTVDSHRELKSKMTIALVSMLGLLVVVASSLFVGYKVGESYHYNDIFDSVSYVARQIPPAVRGNVSQIAQPTPTGKLRDPQQSTKLAFGGSEISQISQPRTTGKAGDSQQSKKPKIPFLFVHINKTGGTSLIKMFAEYCPREYYKEKWTTVSGTFHRSFHSTAHSYIVRHGREIWNDAFTFAVVRHPLARQVSNFFFLLGRCHDEEDCLEKRLLPKGAIYLTTDEEKIDAFHGWIHLLYENYPPGSRDNYILGSKGHGNEDYSTFNATQTSWMIDPQGEIAVKKVFKLEELSSNMNELSDEIPCLKQAEMLANNNISPKYPHYTKFTGNKRTSRIINEVFDVDFRNFGYDTI